MKCCSRCGQTKPFTSFGKCRSNKDGYQRWCKECRKAHYGANREKVLAYHKAYNAANRDKISVKNKAYRAANPDRVWANGLWTRHGMRPWEWQSMHDEQSALCYLCQRPLSEDRGKIVIDHDHACCPVNSSCSACRRGLACHDCNVAIGILGENPELIRMVADNLEKRQAVMAALMASRPQPGRLF